MSVPNVVSEPPWQAGLRSARANLGPGLVLQAVALAIVLAYYYHPPTHAALERLAALHDRAGVIYGIISTGLFGGVLPFLYLRSNPATRAQHTLREGGALTAFWCYKGLEIDVLYRLLARVVGEGHNGATIVIKTCVDQFIYSPFVAVPTIVVAYQWCTGGLTGRAIFADFRAPGWYVRSALPTLLANLGVWLPAVAIIYALPTPLQLPLENLVLCFFTLLLAHLNRRRKRNAVRAPAGAST